MWQNKQFKRYVGNRIAVYKSRKQRFVHSDEKFKGVALRRAIHPLLRRILHIKSLLCGMTYEIIGNSAGLVKNRTVVYAGTHIGKGDWEMLMEAFDMFSYPVAGDWELMYGEADDYFLRLHGVMYMDTEDKEDRKNTFRLMLKALRSGISVFIFPEGIWNLSESLPMQPIFPGAVKAAKLSGVPIVPVAIDQRGKHFVMNVGKSFLVETEEWDRESEKLRDILATLKWEIWEHYPIERRADIPQGYFEKFIANRLAEWPQFNMDTVNHRVRKG